MADAFKLRQQSIGAGLTEPVQEKAVRPAAEK
jgi:hypothetical protein